MYNGVVFKYIFIDSIITRELILVVHDNIYFLAGTHLHVHDSSMQTCIMV